MTVRILFAALAALNALTLAGVPAPGVVPSAHRPAQIMGWDYWTVLSALPYSDPTQNPTGDLFNAELASLPVFRDCALINQTSLRKGPLGKAVFARLEENYKDGADDPRWKSFEGNPKPDHPLFSYMVTKRDPKSLVGSVELDHGQYADWKARHPNFCWFRMLTEWGVNLDHLSGAAQKIADPQVRAEFERRWCAPVRDRYARLDFAHRYFDRQLELHYGDTGSIAALRSFYALDHCAAAWGAKAILLETTNTTGPRKEYRWSVMGMFTRGAARQFSIPWGWYVAVYANGPGQDGTWMDNSTPSYSEISRSGSRRKFPEGGVSASLFNRVCHYAYLNGAGAVEVESWSGHLLQPGEGGRQELSPRGRLFSNFHDFTRRHPDRGIPYAPVAVLVPFAQGYPATGGKSWATFDYCPGDYAVDSVFFTLQRGFDRPTELAKGHEHNLHNSPFPVMCDVLAPDAPQDPETFFSVLTNYPYAVVAGEYADRSFESVLERYRRAGGEIFRVDEGVLPPFAGDLPGEMWAGKRRFPAVERFFSGVRDSCFPVRVQGDVLWGMNRTSTGWWLWCLNNRGVTKFADRYESIDASAASRIRVELVGLDARSVREIVGERDVATVNGEFEWTVPAGGLAIFDIRQAESDSEDSKVRPLPPLPDGAFTYAVIPDTQRYGGKGMMCKAGMPSPDGPTTNVAFVSRVKWLCDNIGSQRIAFVSHVGDIVDVNNDCQWAFASNLMSRLDGRVPYGISPGNHDMRDVAGDTTLFSRYFPLARFRRQPGFAGNFDGFTSSDGTLKCAQGANTCRLFEAGGMRFVLVHVECNAPTPVMEWADEMLGKYADRHAIFVTHAYLGPLTWDYRKRLNEMAKEKSRQTGRPVNPYPPETLGRMRWATAHTAGDEGLAGEDMWTNHLFRHKNLFLVVCGDQSTVISYRRQSVGRHGNFVSEVMQDYPRAADSDDCIRLFRFLPKERRIRVYTYSPTLGGIPKVAAFKTEWADHCFELPFPEPLD